MWYGRWEDRGRTSGIPLVRAIWIRCDHQSFSQSWTCWARMAQWVNRSANLATSFSSLCDRQLGMLYVVVVGCCMWLRSTVVCGFGWLLYVVVVDCCVVEALQCCSRDFSYTHFVTFHSSPAALVHWCLQRHSVVVCKKPSLKCRVLREENSGDLLGYFRGFRALQHTCTRTADALASDELCSKWHLAVKFHCAMLPLASSVTRVWFSVCRTSKFWDWRWEMWWNTWTKKGIGSGACVRWGRELGAEPGRYIVSTCEIFNGTIEQSWSPLACLLLEVNTCFPTIFCDTGLGVGVC